MILRLTTRHESSAGLQTRCTADVHVRIFEGATGETVEPGPTGAAILEDGMIRAPK